MRRIAVLKLCIAGKTLARQVLELEGNRLLRYYPLKEELPHTEWLPMTAIVEDGIVRLVWSMR